jgi:phosphoribosylformimino-5-aminoimidazole carboxamide ribotide isomerase
MLSNYPPRPAQGLERGFRRRAGPEKGPGAIVHGQILFFKGNRVPRFFNPSRPSIKIIKKSMKFRPCIDIHDGKVKQIVGSSLSEEGALPVTNFETHLSPAHFAGMYREDGLFGGHVIMLGPGNENAAKEALAAFPGGLHAGGGIDPDNALGFLSAGASHVIVTSFVFSNGHINRENLQTMMEKTGKNRLVLDLSCKKQNNGYFVATDRWQKLTGVALSAQTLGGLARYCDEFLVHAVDVEGKQEGVDAGLVALLAEASPIAVTYAGGVRSLADLEIIRREGKGRVDATVGSALDIFGGPLPYRDVVKWHRQNNNFFQR